MRSTFLAAGRAIADSTADRVAHHGHGMTFGARFDAGAHVERFATKSAVHRDRRTAFARGGRNAGHGAVDSPAFIGEVFRFAAFSLLAAEQVAARAVRFRLRDA